MQMLTVIIICQISSILEGKNDNWIQMSTLWLEIFKLAVENDSICLFW